MDRLLAWDEALIVRVAGARRAWANQPMRVLTHSADHMSYWVHCAIAWAVFGPFVAALLGAGSGGAATVAQVFKRSIRRRRPDQKIPGFVAIDANPDHFAFPSGHTCGTVGAAAALMFGAPQLAVAYAIFAVFVGASRVYLGAHYPLDVLGGALIGISAGSASGWLVTVLWPVLF